MEKFGQEMGNVRVPAGELRELLSRLASSDGVMDSDQPTIRDVAEVSGKSVGEVAAALTAIRGTQVAPLPRLVRQKPLFVKAILGAVALMFMLLGILLLSSAPPQGVVPTDAPLPVTTPSPDSMPSPVVTDSPSRAPADVEAPSR